PAENLSVYRVRGPARVKEKGRPVSGTPSLQTLGLNLQQAEVHFDAGLHRDGFSVLHAWPELPLAYGFDRLFIQTPTQAVQNPDVRGFAGGIDFHVQRNRTLILGLASFFGVFRLFLEEQRGSTDAAAYAEHATAYTAAFAGSETTALTGTHSAA